MRRLSPGLAALALLGASACGGEPDVAETPEPEAAATETTTPAPETAPPPASATDEAAVADAVAREAVPAAQGAPAFAVIYPGGRIEGADEDDSGPGGLVTYVTTATPDEVIAFHRARAEAEGLASVMAMNQGEARAYGAHSTRNGANLSVFATPVEDGVSVQLVWSAGG